MSIQRYNQDELAWLKANCTMVIGEYHQAFCEAFGVDVSQNSLKSLRMRKGWKTGRIGYFEKGVKVGVRFQVGHTSPRKGKKNPPNTLYDPCKYFGQLNKQYKPIGTERTMTGLRQRKINDDFPKRKRWKFVHLIEWEAVHGSIPAGMVLKCRGDLLDVDPSSWLLVPRAILPRLNGLNGQVAYNDAAENLKPVILATARLAYAASSRVRNGVRVDAARQRPGDHIIS